MSRGIELHLMATIWCRKRLCRGRAVFGRRGLPARWAHRVTNRLDCAGPPGQEPFFGGYP